MKKICIIPARGGSKRIPNKNIRSFNGEPIISWVIKTALNSECFDKVIVSTDSDEIKNVSREYGAQVPFKRPDLLSDDHAPTLEVIKHAIKEVNNEKDSFDIVCCLYPTAPLVQISDLKKGMEQIIAMEIKNFIFSATYYEYPIQRALIEDANNLSTMLDSKFLDSRSQDLPSAFHDAGQFYIGKEETWLTSNQILEGSLPLFIPKFRVQDIDTEEDWERAEFLHKYLVSKKI